MRFWFGLGFGSMFIWTRFGFGSDGGTSLCEICVVVDQSVDAEVSFGGFGELMNEAVFILQ